MARSVRSRAWALALGLAACRQEPHPEVLAAAAVPSTPSPTSTVPAVDATRVTIHRARDLAEIDLRPVQELDLALSPTDQIGFLDDEPADARCEGLDAARLAASTPALRSLRWSGCAERLDQGLAAFSGRLEELRLADVTLDRPTIMALAAIGPIPKLVLQRVRTVDESLRPLHALHVQDLTLTELRNDSELDQLLSLWPHTLAAAHLDGRWAGYQAVSELSRAHALRTLSLTETRAGNYSLHQLHALEHIVDITLVGDSFTDLSPHYFRGLPVKRFHCDCPRLGDAGLRGLQRLTELEQLELPHSRITAAGLEALEGLGSLGTFVADDVDLSGPGFDALASLKQLRRLELSGTLDDPRMTHLGRLTRLRHLRLSYPNLDDRAAAQLAGLTRLQTLDLAGTQISDEGLEAVAQMTDLRELRLGHTRVTHRGLRHLTQLAHLRVLELDGTDVVDGGVAFLGSLASLEVLRLDGTLITDTALAHLRGLQRLRKLNLAGTVVTAAGVRELHRLPALEVLGLAGTRADAPPAVLSPVLASPL